MKTEQDRKIGKARAFGRQVRDFTFPVRDRDFRTAAWPGTGGIIAQCVSVAKTPQGVAIRDTKDVTNKTLYFTPAEWNAFSQGMKAGEFDCD